VAVVAELADRERVARGLALAPELLPGPAVEVRLAGLAGQALGLVVHPREHEDVARSGVLDDRRAERLRLHREPARRGRGARRGATAAAPGPRAGSTRAAPPVRPRAPLRRAAPRPRPRTRSPGPRRRLRRARSARGRSRRASRRCRSTSAGSRPLRAP